MRHVLLLAALGLVALGCSLEPASSEPVSEASDVTTEATLKLTADFKTQLIGRPAAGKGFRIEYAPERLPQCRGLIGGGVPGWAITGYYSENGGPAKTFDPTELSPDNKTRLMKPVTIIPEQGGDLALWFQVSSRWGCSEYDSANGQNYHFSVAGPPATATASLHFTEDGSVAQDGPLRAGEKVKIRYEQDRLPDCRRVERGNPVWTITGYASIDGGEPQVFQTGRPDGYDREAIDTILDLPRSGELSLWFQVTSLGGCSAYDSKHGQNYRFAIE
jgi:hypothetical protein